MDYHEAIALLGIGSAHPGGFQGTLAWMDRIQLKEKAKILEIGCGTGRTACALAERFAVEVTGVDIRQKMIDQAIKRAAAMSLPVVFQKVTGGKLPFANETFDAAVAESVTVFNPIQKQLREYGRVLRKGGWMVDTEMCASSPLPPEVMRDFERTYGARAVPTMSAWKKLFIEAGFTEATVLLSGPVNASLQGNEQPDHFAKALSSDCPPELLAIIQENQRVMYQHSKWLHYAVLKAQK